MTTVKNDNNLQTVDLQSGDTYQIKKKQLTLNELRKLIKKEDLEPPSVRNFFGAFIKIGLYFLAFYFACNASGFLATAFFTFAAGYFLFSLGTLGHDCGHGAYIRPRWLNEAIGTLSMSLHGLPYEGWKHSHNTHHANTNRGELDPDRLWLYDEEYIAMGKTERFFWRMFQTRFFWMSAIGHYFRSMLPWSFKIKEKTDNQDIINRCKRDTFIWIGIVVTFIASYAFMGFSLLKIIPVYLITVALAFMWLSAYVRTEHYLLDNGYDLHDKPWVTSRTTTHHPILDFFATNLNYHIEHHILQTVPHANLPYIRPLMKKTILEANEIYPEDEFWSFMKMSFNHEFTLMEKETFKERPISQVPGILAKL
ncbi:MAG TPA: fatty acid desaturase [Vampirovibrionales bacterium]